MVDVSMRVMAWGEDCTCGGLGSWIEMDKEAVGTGSAFKMLAA